MKRRWMRRMHDFGSGKAFGAPKDPEWEAGTRLVRLDSLLVTGRPCVRPFNGRPCDRPLPAVLVRVARDGPLHAVPGVAAGALGLFPVQARLALGLLVFAAQRRLVGVEGL